ncbi:MAG TPA: hypothetical protein VFX37_10430, partial [Pseudolabrys sp.]|nr:hypothetical protein [Pseudolabrys sp.]
MSIMRALFVLSALTFSGYALANDYNVNLVRPDVSWGAVISPKRLPYDPKLGIVSKGPFIIDLNHRENALLVGPLVVWANGYKPDGDPKTALGKIDLTNTTVELNASVDDPELNDPANPLSQGKAVFWFQSDLIRKTSPGGDYKVPARIANYAFSRNILPEVKSGKDVSIDMTPDLNQWTCMSQNPLDLRPMIGSAAKYTCALDHEEFAWAMAHPIDMGILLFLPGYQGDKPIKWLDPRNPGRTPIMQKATFYMRKFIIKCDPCATTAQAITK